MLKRILLAAFVFCAPVVLTGCGGADETKPAATATDSGADSADDSSEDTTTE